MYQYVWDEETGGLLLTTELAKFSKEPRPVYYKELDILGFDKFWNYPKDDFAPLMWAEANNYIYRGRKVAFTKGGALYTAPELVLLEEPEPNGQPLKFVDIPAMVKKNSRILETLVQETIQKVYNTYKRYKNKVDIFHVSYSGGKDSEVLLDIVQRALPHDEFIVLFGDTGMEFPDTYNAVENVKKKCADNEVKFVVARADTDPVNNWKTFGPPSQILRWCCSVHKTTPQLLKLREIVGKSNLVEMSFVGVRGDESLRRSAYDFVSFGTKHKGQYSFNPILAWSSAEVYLYIFKNALYLNEAYKKGNSRAGCLLCPMASERHDFIRNANYPKQISTYTEIIKSTNARELPTEKDNDRFIQSGGWKARTNGRDIISLPVRYCEKPENVIEEYAISQDWKVWLKTLGEFVIKESLCLFKREGKTFSFSVEENAGHLIVTIPNELVKKSPKIARYIKQVFRKAAYCIGCKECQADCPYGCLKFIKGKLIISDDCRKCLNCHKPETGCLLYKSLEQPKGSFNMNNQSIDSYADHAPKIEWIQSFFKLGNLFMKEHGLGSVMIDKFRRFLRDAELIDKDKMTHTAHILSNIGISRPAFWGIMLVNLSYTPEIGWYVKNISVDEQINRDEIIEKLKAAGTKDRGAKSITGAYKRILSLPFGSELGLGSVIMNGKTYEGIIRKSWDKPEPLVILYSLYKFAEHCGDYQFSLTTLLDDTIEREGVSPTRIFGLSREVMIPLLNGLSANYPEYINVSFTLGLDTITLREDKKSEDVLELF